MANAVMGSVPQQEAGVASGTNSAIRGLGGVFGVAVLAAVFTGPAVLGSPDAFVDAFKPALWVGAGLAAVGTVSALLAPRHQGPQPVEAADSAAAEADAVPQMARTDA
ncbi:hypothetical protein [Streptomyces sp. NPDC005408]|uniref:hypothetical protein n=1 Tax=Streptomyces sp. NPDC005408 TaxID=3155341 RepID=UPI0033BD5110